MKDKPTQTHEYTFIAPSGEGVVKSFASDEEAKKAGEADAKIARVQSVRTGKNVFLRGAS